MSTALGLLVPGALLVYFVVRSFHQRIFLLGIPFLFYLGVSIFADKFKPLWVPGRLDDASDHAMIWLVIVWVIFFDLLLPRASRSSIRTPVFGPRPALFEEAIILAFAGLVVLEIVLTAVETGDLVSVLAEARPYVYLIVGYFMLRGMFWRAGRQDTLDFIAALVLVNSFSAGLFVLHQGLHLAVYDVEEYQAVAFMGQVLTRSFYFMPQLLILSLAYCLTRERWNALWLAVFVVNIAAIWVSYTRSLMIIAAVVIALVLGMKMLKARAVAHTLRRGVAILGILLVFAGVAFVFLPTETRYLFSRFEGISAAGGVSDEPNLKNRQNKVSVIYEWIAPKSALLGVGFVSPGQDAHVARAERMTADLVWVIMLFRFGVVGAAVTALLYVAGSWRALRLSAMGTGAAEVLGLILLAVLIGSFLEGFVSWVFVNPDRYPLGLWAFALLAAEAQRRRTEAAEFELGGPAPVQRDAVRQVANG
jgi:hypothetical protein